MYKMIPPLVKISAKQIGFLKTSIRNYDSRSVSTNLVSDINEMSILFATVGKD